MKHLLSIFMMQREEDAPLMMQREHDPPLPPDQPPPEPVKEPPDAPVTPPGSPVDEPEPTPPRRLTRIEILPIFMQYRAIHGSGIELRTTWQLLSSPYVQGRFRVELCRFAALKIIQLATSNS